MTLESLAKEVFFYSLVISILVVICTIFVLDKLNTILERLPAAAAPQEKEKP